MVLCCMLFFMSEFTLCLYIILLVRFGLLSGHRVGKSCPFGWPFVLIVFCQFFILGIFRFSFESGVSSSLLVSIACLLL